MAKREKGSVNYIIRIIQLPLSIATMGCPLRRPGNSDVGANSVPFQVTAEVTEIGRVQAQATDTSMVMPPT